MGKTKDTKNWLEDRETGERKLWKNECVWRERERERERESEIHDQNWLDAIAWRVLKESDCLSCWIPQRFCWKSQRQADASFYRHFLLPILQTRLVLSFRKTLPSLNTQLKPLWVAVCTRLAQTKPSLLQTKSFNMNINIVCLEIIDRERLLHANVSERFNHVLIWALNFCVRGNLLSFFA